MEITAQQTAALAEHGLTGESVEVACRMAQAIADAAEDVAADTRDEAFDDATSRGQLLYRRARNRIIADFSAGAEDARGPVADTNLPPSVVLDTTDNALHVRVGALAISFYAARNGLDFPSLVGSETKRRVLAEMEQMVIPGLEVEPRRTIIMHESDETGLVRAAIGVLRSANAWAWHVPLIDRYADESDREEKRQLPAYDEQPEAELPKMQRRRESETGETGKR